jgi:TonB family protein
LLASTPAFAQAPSPQAATAAQNDAMWNVFLKLYPARALKAHEEGAVGFLVTLNNKGDVTNCQVTHSSGHPLLDEETCRLVTLNAVFKPDPNLSPSQTRTHEGLITWKLPDSTTSLQSPQEVAATDAPGKIICKKNVKTGTLSAAERTCMTQRQWNRQSDDAKDMWEDIQGKKGSTHGN